MNASQALFPSLRNGLVCLGAPYVGHQGQILLDLSGFRNDGAINGSTWIPGRNGWALDFDGDYVSLGNIFAAAESKTITAWVYLDVITQDGGIITKFNNVAGDWLLWFDDVVGVGPGANDRISYAVVNAGIPSTWLWIYSSALKALQWYHVAVTHDYGVGAKIYINGVEDTAYTQNLTATDLGASATDVRIGNSVAAGKVLNGRINSLSVYNRVLLPQEIAILTAIPHAPLLRRADLMAFLAEVAPVGPGLDLFDPQIKAILPNRQLKAILSDRQVKAILPDRQIKWIG